MDLSKLVAGVLLGKQGSLICSKCATCWAALGVPGDAKGYSKIYQQPAGALCFAGGYECIFQAH